MQLKEERFDKLFTSPLARATETADIVWGGDGGERTVLEGLREIDLYSFQGLLKAEGIARYGTEFSMWQKAPAEFCIDGHSPVVELWHRASMAWHQILQDPDVDSCALVVAHNAVNQALVGTAVGIGPEKFRRLLQSNAATSVLDFVPRVGGGPPVVTIDRLNQVRYLHCQRHTAVFFTALLRTAECACRVVYTPHVSLNRNTDCSAAGGFTHECSTMLIMHSVVCHSLTTHCAYIRCGSHTFCLHL